MSSFKDRIPGTSASAGYLSTAFETGCEKNQDTLEEPCLWTGLHPRVSMEGGLEIFD